MSNPYESPEQDSDSELPPRRWSKGQQAVRIFAAFMALSSIIAMIVLLRTH